MQPIGESIFLGIIFGSVGCILATVVFMIVMYVKEQVCKIIYKIKRRKNK